MPQGGRQIPPQLLTAAGAQARADDDLGAGGPHLLHRLQRGGDALRLPALAPRRRLAGPGADVAVGPGLEPLDDVSVVGEAGAKEMNQERRRGVAGHRHRCRHGAASVVPVMGNGGGASLRDAIRSPASGQALPLAGAGRRAGAGRGRIL